MNTSLSSGSLTLMPSTQLLDSLDNDSSVLKTMIDILAQPRVRTCPFCLGKGLLAHHLVCPGCQGYGKTP